MRYERDDYILSLMGPSGEYTVLDLLLRADRSRKLNEYKIGTSLYRLYQAKKIWWKEDKYGLAKQPTDYKSWNKIKSMGDLPPRKEVLLYLTNGTTVIGSAIPGNDFAVSCDVGDTYTNFMPIEVLLAWAPISIPDLPE